MIFGPTDFNCTQTGQMIGQKLHVKQHESPGAQAVHKVGQRDFRGVGPAREHAFAEKGPAKRDSVNTANQLIVNGNFQRMGVSRPMQRAVKFGDFRIDPGFRAIRTIAYSSGKIHIDPNAMVRPPDGPRQRAGNMKPIQRHDAAKLRIDPENLVRETTLGHRKYAARISAQQQLRRDVKAIVGGH